MMTLMPQYKFASWNGKLASAFLAVCVHSTEHQLCGGTNSWRNIFYWNITLGEIAITPFFHVGSPRGLTYGKTISKNAAMPVKVPNGG